MPSRTAMIAAMARASHLLHYGPRALLADWLAWPLAGADAEAILAKRRELLSDLDVVPICVWIAARSRLAEDWLTASAAEQYVILGAGLDSFAWRQPERVRVFEVDQPSTQAWKRERVAALGMPTPAELTWTPVDFEQISSARRWLKPDSTPHAGCSSAGWVSSPTSRPTPSFRRCTTYRIVRWRLGTCRRTLTATKTHENSAARSDDRVRELGEPWVTLPTRNEFAALLAEGGFTVIEDVGAHDIETRYGIPAVNFERMTLARKAS